MRSLLLATFLFTSLVAGQIFAHGMTKEIALNPDQLKWEDSKSLPGSWVALVEGDFNKKGCLTFRHKLPAGHKVPAHWLDGHVHATVLSGKIKISSELKKNQPMNEIILEKGGFLAMPAKTVHMVEALEESEVQLEGMGPLKTHYVNPSDDPMKMKPTTKPSDKKM